MRPPDGTSFWQWFKDYLSFHAQERTKIISFATFILLLTAVQLYLSFREPVRNLESIKFLGEEHFVKLKAQIDSAEAEKQWNKNSQKNWDKKEKAPLVPFNPNELDSAGWRNLGLSPKQSQVMVRIRNERGGFKSKQELERINMLNHVIDRIRPYIQLLDSLPRKTWEKNKYPKTEFKPDSSKPKWKKKEFKKLNIDLNKTDTLELVGLYGIGPSFAKRIIKFRDGLGGFNSKQQLLEVWGMDSFRYAGIQDEVFVSQTELQKININAAEYDSLKSHPYIKYNVAKSIVNYREQHGAFSEIDQLLKIHLIDDDLLRKLKPYLATE